MSAFNIWSAAGLGGALSAPYAPYARLATANSLKKQDSPRVVAAAPAEKEPFNSKKFMADLAAGGTAGGVSKTIVAPIERVKLLLQTQDANPLIKSGEIPRYTGIVNCFRRVAAEQVRSPFLSCSWLLKFIY